MSVREPVSRRGGPVRPALSRAAIVEAALAVAGRQGLDAVSMRHVAEELDTGASALYVYVRNRDDLLEAMFDQAMAEVAAAALPAGDWRERLTALLLRSIDVASGHGGLARIALTAVPDGPNAVAVTDRVRALLAEGGLPDAAVPAALDLLALFVTGAALDRVPTGAPEQRRERLRWEIDVILSGLLSVGAPGGGSGDRGQGPAVGAGGRGGAVGAASQGPAPAVDDGQVMEPAEQGQVGQGGRPGPGPGNQVVHLADGGRLLTAGEPAVPVAQGDGPPEVRGNDRRGRPHIEG